MKKKLPSKPEKIQRKPETLVERKLFSKTKKGDTYTTSFKCNVEERDAAEDLILRYRSEAEIKLSFADILREGLPLAMKKLEKDLDDALSGKSTSFKKRKQQQ